MELPNKDYRFESNPEEKLFYDKFSKLDKNNVLDLIVFGQKSCTGVYPKGYLTEREKEIAKRTIQWIGTPIGKNFLKEIGYEKIER